MATVQDYLNLITAEHNQAPRFMTTVELSIEPYVDGSNTALSLISLFDLDTAVGQQLDMLGQWVGISRDISIALEIWFAFDQIRVGFDQGEWINPYQTRNQIVQLDDEHYRLVLRGRIASNHWDGTLPGAYDAWNTLFQPTGYQILIQDGLPRAERDFSLDTTAAGFDQSIWAVPPPLAAIYFTLDSADPPLGFDQGYWLGRAGTSITVPARTNGNMHVIQALLGPPVDAITKALFAGGYLTLKSAGVQVDYLIQGQGSGAGLPPGQGSGIGLPLFGFDAGPGDSGYWMSFDDAAAGLDHAPLFYPGAHPIDPDFDPPLLTFDANDPAHGLDAGWWTPAIRPSYLVFDSIDPTHQLNSAEWYTPGAYYPPVWDPSTPLPPTGVTWPPIPIAGFDLGAFGEILTG